VVAVTRGDVAGTRITRAQRVTGQMGMRRGTWPAATGQEGRDDRRQGREGRDFR
jgi:hypothetical protein